MFAIAFTHVQPVLHADECNDGSHVHKEILEQLEIK